MEILHELPRGWRNCNPGNIKKSNDHFRGEVEGDDKVFKTFSSMEWGFRALLMILHTYIVKYDLRTLRQIAERWAPNGENDTKSYIYNLCELTGWKDDDQLFFTPGMATKLATAIATIECGRAPKRVDVEMGWTLCNKDLEAQRRAARLKRAARGNLGPSEGGGEAPPPAPPLQGGEK